MKNNTKTRYFVGTEDETGEIHNASTVTFAIYEEAEKFMAGFQMVDRYQPYYTKDLTKLHVIKRTVKTSFIKYLQNGKAV